MCFVAQHGEDRWLHANWSALQLPEKGFFVEVGAADGVLFSNTLWLERAKGWHGVLVEPDPRWHIRDRPNCLVERVAIGQPGTISFGLMPNPTHSGILRSCMSRFSVPSSPLTAILDKHRIEKLDVLSIDSEGTETEVWKTLDLNRWRPAIVIVEWNTEGLPDKRAEINSVWHSDGYELITQLGGNYIFRDCFK
jgi:FkbM family methyltransferase